MMKRNLIQCLVTALIFSIFLLPVWGKDYEFRLGEDAELCGVTLSRGDYNLTVSEDVAGVYKGKKLLVTAKVEVLPLRGEIAHSCKCLDGQLKEIRLDKEKVIILEKIEPTAQTK